MGKAQASIELLQAEATNATEEKESTLAQYATEQQARLAAEKEATEALEQQRRLLQDHQLEKSARISTEQSLQQILSEKAAKELQYEQEKKLLETAQDAEVAELSRLVEHIKNEKDTERRARLAAELASEKHLSDAWAERQAHREERDRIFSQSQEVQVLLQKLEKLSAEREAAVAANLARVAADNQVKMLAVQQGVEDAIAERATAQFEAFGLLADGLDALARRIDAITAENGLQLKPMELYIIAAAFVVVPLLMVFAWAKPVLHAADLALRASTHRQSLQDMIRERHARRLGGSSAAVTPLNVSGTLVFELVDFAGFAEDELAKCLMSTLDDIRSILVTKTEYGVAWQWTVRSTTGGVAARDSAAAEVRNAVAEIMRAKLSVANPQVFCEFGQANMDATTGEEDPTAPIHLYTHVVATCCDDAVEMLSDFTGNTELHDQLVQLASQRFASVEENAASSLHFCSMVGTVECSFIANTETVAEDAPSGIQMLRESLESDAVSQAIWKRFAAAPDDSMMSVKRLQVREPPTRTAVSSDAAPMPLFDIGSHTRLGKLASGVQLSGEADPPGNDPTGIDWLRDVRLRTVVDLAGAALEDPGAVRLASELRMKDCALTSLNCANSAVGPLGLSALAAALDVCETITALCIVTAPEVFYKQWRARDAADMTNGESQARQLLVDRAVLLRRIQASILRNQRARPHQMRFLKTDLEIFAKDFDACGALVDLGY